jgi:hypothetical protein
MGYMGSTPWEASSGWAMRWSVEQRGMLKTKRPKWFQYVYGVEQQLAIWPDISGYYFACGNKISHCGYIYNRHDI